MVKQLFHLGVSVLDDLSLGEDIKIDGKRRLNEAGQHLTYKAATKVKTMIGSGQRYKKRKRSNKVFIRRKRVKRVKSKK